MWASFKTAVHAAETIWDDESFPQLVGMLPRGAQRKPQLQLSMKHGSERFTYGASTVSTLSVLQFMLRMEKLLLSPRHLWLATLCRTWMCELHRTMKCIWQEETLAFIVFRSIYYVSMADVSAGPYILKRTNHGCRFDLIRVVWVFLKETLARDLQEQEKTELGHQNEPFENYSLIPRSIGAHAWICTGIDTKMYIGTRSQWKVIDWLSCEYLFIDKSSTVKIHVTNRAIIDCCA